MKNFNKLKLLESISNFANQAASHSNSITYASVYISSGSGKCKCSDYESINLILEFIFLNQAMIQKELTKAIITVVICSDC